MYEILLERTAERDLKRLSHEIFQRIIDHIKALADTPRPTGCHKITGSKVTGGSKLGITGFFMRSMKKK